MYKYKLHLALSVHVVLYYTQVIRRCCVLQRQTRLTGLTTLSATEQGDCGPVLLLYYQDLLECLSEGRDRCSLMMEVYHRCVCVYRRYRYVCRRPN